MREHTAREFSTQIPKLQLEWSASSYSTLLQCPRRYQLQTLEGWHSPGDRINLDFGSAYHEALAAYDTALHAGATFDDAVDCAVKIALCFPLPLFDNIRNRFTLVRSVVWYTEQFHNDPLPTSALDSGPGIEVYFTLDTGIKASTGEEFKFRGYLDKIVERDGRRAILERKTTGKTLGEAYFNGFSPDNQVTLYSVGGVSLLEGETVEVIIEACQVAVGFSRYERHSVFRKREYLDEFLGEMKYWLAQAEVFATLNMWPKNETACRICPFARVCSKSPHTRKMWLEAEFVQ